MNIKLKLFFTIVLLICAQLIFGQNNRLHTNNIIGWYNYFGTFKLSDKFGLHTEYQWRRNNIITEWQQSVVRIGVNYQLNPRVLFRAGYAGIETFPYGKISINGFGRNFTEHRIFEMAQLSHKESIFDFSHRFIFEQRFIGRYSQVNIQKEDKFPLSHRVRYMIRVQMPLKGKEIKNRTPYAAAYDEIFIGFGKNVNANIFDQNRLGVLLGYRFNKNLRLEAGYINQILQFGRQINGKNVFQNNNGLILNTNFNLNLTKKEI